MEWREIGLLGPRVLQEVRARTPLLVADRPDPLAVGRHRGADADRLDHQLGGGRCCCSRTSSDARAAERLREPYAVLLKPGRLAGICWVGLDWGQLLCDGGRVEDKAILLRSRDGFLQLGRADRARRVAELLEGLPAAEDG